MQCFIGQSTQLKPDCNLLFKTARKDVAGSDCMKVVLDKIALKVCLFNSKSS